MATKLPLASNEIFAARELSVMGEDSKVLVCLGIPKAVSDSEAVCPYRFTYKDETIGLDVSGVDAFQAIQLALKTIPVELRHNGLLPLGKMYLHEPDDDMGFPQKDGWQ